MAGWGVVSCSYSQPSTLISQPCTALLLQMEEPPYQRMLAGEKILAAPGEQHRAAERSVPLRAQHDAAGGDTLEAQQVVRHYYHCGSAFAAQRDSQVVNLLGAHGIEAGGGLVADKQPWIQCEGAGEGGAFLHAAAELARILLRMGVELHGTQLHEHGVLEKIAVARNLGMMLLKGQGHVFRNGEALKQGARLEKHAHIPHEPLALAPGEAVDVLAEDMHGAGGGFVHADEDVQQGALPTAGPAEDGENIAGEDIEAHVVEHVGAVWERLDQIPHYEQWLGGGRGRGGRRGHERDEQ